MAIIRGLHSSRPEGKAPLLVGFVVDGPTVADRKVWHIKSAAGDDVVDERNDNLVYEYRFENPGDYKVWVDIVDVRGKTIESGYQHKKDISVRGKNKLITSFAQRQAVIQKGEHVGFAMSFEIKPYQLRWEWGDEGPPHEPPFPKIDTNPDHQYKKIGIFEGNLVYRIDKKKSEVKEFGVMALDPRFDPGVHLNVTLWTPGHPDPSDMMPFPSGETLTFTVALAGGKLPYNYTCVFGDRTSKEGQSQKKNISFRKEGGYDKADYYPVKLTITDSRGYKFIVSQTIIIRESQ